jgi:hypothetical protein
MLMWAPALIIGIICLRGFISLGRAWWIYTKRAATAERFGRITGYLWSAVGRLTAASVIIVFLLDVVPGWSTQGWAILAGLATMVAFDSVERRVPKWAEDWCIRHRHVSPDFAEDAEGNPVRTPADG